MSLVAEGKTTMPTLAKDQGMFIRPMPRRGAEWDRHLMRLRAQLRLTHGQLRAVGNSLELFGRAMAREGQ